MNDTDFVDKKIEQAKVYREKRNYEQAKEILEKLLEQRKNKYDVSSYEEYKILTNLALVSRDLNDLGNAKRLLEELLASFKKNHPPEKRMIADANYYMALVYTDLGNYLDANRCLKTTIEIDKSNPDTNEFQIAMAYRQLALTHHYLGENRKAKQIYIKVLKKYEDEFGDDNKNISDLESEYFFVLCELKEINNAILVISKTIDRETKRKKPYYDSDVMGDCYFRLGGLYFQIKDYNNAKSSYDKALHYYRNHFGFKHIQTYQEYISETKLELAIVLKKLGYIERSKEILYDVYFSFSKKFPPNHPKKKYADKVLRKVVGLKNYRRVKRELGDDFDGFIQSGGWSSDFHVYEVKRRDKWAAIGVSITLLFLIALAIYNYQFAWSSSTVWHTILGLLLNIFIYILYFTIIISIYTTTRKIIKYLKVYGVNDIKKNTKIMQHLRRRQREKTSTNNYEIDKIEYKKRENKTIKYLFRILYIFSIAIDTRESWQEYEDVVSESEVMTGFKLNIITKFMINIFGKLIIFIGTFITWIYFDYQLLFLFCIAYFLSVIEYLILFYKPPSCLLLATSKAETLNLQGRINMALKFLGVASLLKLDGEYDIKKYGLDNSNIFRTREDVEWMNSVKDLIDFVPFIIIDGRFQSFAVTNEIDYLFKKKPKDKLIFIVTSKDSNEFFLKNVNLEQYIADKGNIQLLNETELLLIISIMVKEIKSFSIDKLLKFNSEQLPVALQFIQNEEQKKSIYQL